VNRIARRDERVETTRMDVAAILTTLASSPWTYAVVALIAALDAVFPLVPSEATLITAGVFAASGDLAVWGVIAAAAAGAFFGDNVSYTVGRLGRRRLPQRALRSARSVLGKRGGLVLVVARFVPGGRTAATLTAGAVMRRRRFAVLVAGAAVVWAAYGASLGYFGGRAFEENPWLGIGAAFVAAAALALVLEGARRAPRPSSFRAWRRWSTGRSAPRASLCRSSA
jgi:membrane-associated protein